MMTETGGPIFLGGKGYKPLPWAPMLYMDEYLADLAAGKSPRSPNYARVLKVGMAHFGAYAAGREILHPDQIGRSDILGYQVHLASLVTQRGAIVNTCGLSISGCGLG